MGIPCSCHDYLKKKIERFAAEKIKCILAVPLNLEFLNPLLSLPPHSQGGLPQLYSRKECRSQYYDTL